MSTKQTYCQYIIGIFDSWAMQAKKWDSVYISMFEHKTLQLAFMLAASKDDQ